jgi:hypothetical protein
VGSVTIESVKGQGERKWLATAGSWNRRVSLAAVLLLAAVVLLYTWAETIRFGGWFGVFLGWWPAMLIASGVAFVTGRAWQALTDFAVSLFPEWLGRRD